MRHLRTLRGLRGGWQLVEACAAPDRCQRSVLREILCLNRDTEFARDHGLGPATTLDQYRRRVPVRRYDELRPWMDRTVRGVPRVLVAEPVRTVAATSGSTAAPKHVPITRAYLRALRAVEDLWLEATLHEVPAAAAGDILVLASPRFVGPLAPGVACGTITGLALPLGGAEGHLLVPPEPIERLPSSPLRRYAILLLALRADLTMLAAPAPSALVRFLEELRAWTPWLLDDLGRGSFVPPPGLCVEQAPDPRLGAAPQPERARQLGAGGELSAPRAWPKLALAATWLDGSCALYAQRLRALLPGVGLHKIGYAATEGYFSLACTATDPGSVLALGHYLFELIPEHGSDSDVFALENVEVGRRYRIVVTTPAGLYRYDIEDVVEVVGRAGRAPLVAFSHRCGVASVAEEKLTEAQLLAAVKRVSVSHALVIADLIAAPQLPEQGPGSYRLELELGRAADVGAATLARAFDAVLCEINVDYRFSRDAGRLGPPELTLVSRSELEQKRRALMPHAADDERRKPWHLVLDAWDAPRSATAIPAAAPGDRPARPRGEGA